MKKEAEISGIQERRIAAAPVLEKIATLARDPGLHQRVSAMLTHIHGHLFDPKLKVKTVRAVCGVADNSIAITFHLQVGQSPAVFILESRLTVADRLLATTNLPIWLIAKLLGYSSIQVFSRAFWRYRGKRPSEARKAGRATSGPAEAPRDLLEEALACRLDESTAKELIRRLQALYPG